MISTVKEAEERVKYLIVVPKDKTTKKLEKRTRRTAMSDNVYHLLKTATILFGFAALQWAIVGVASQLSVGLCLSTTIYYLLAAGCSITATKLYKIQQKEKLNGKESSETRRG